MDYLSGRFPAAGLRFPKTDEKPPFMTRAEILRRIASGAKPKEMWPCLFLTITEIQELLKHVQRQASHTFLYPMFCFPPIPVPEDRNCSEQKLATSTS